MTDKYFIITWPCPMKDRRIIDIVKEPNGLAISTICTRYREITGHKVDWIRPENRKWLRANGFIK